MGRRISETRPWPRTKREWTEALADASAVGERIGAPPHGPAARIFRLGVLGVVVAVASVFLLVVSVPFVAVADKSVSGIVERFGGPIDEVELPQIAQRSVVLDRKGRVLATLAGVENRKVVSIDRIARVARLAVIAVEDADFHFHDGVSLGSLVRAFLSNVRAGGIAQGGSTITQQLVKNTLVGNERSIDRKILEARLAIRLEQSLSKREILETYLNETYFGNGVYGIGTAAEYYFGKPAGKLNIPEAAMLAGIIKAPEYYEPFGNPEDAKRRRAYALERMLAEGAITAEEYLAAIEEPLPEEPHRLKPAKTPYIVELVKRQVLADPRFGETPKERADALFQAGLRIETTIDLDLQRAAEDAVKGVLNLPGDPDAALASIDAKTGETLALVGGRDFENNKFDLATQGKRQPGSTFKPFTMVAALDEGFAPSLTFDTPSPLVIKDQGGNPYPVRNYSQRGEGVMDMRDATAFSVNTYYIQLIDKVGPEVVADMAERLGIKTDLPGYYSLALGSIEVTPYELASAYATLADNGTHCEPYSIKRIRDAKGKPLLLNEPDCEQVLRPKVAALATSLLTEVVTRGTGRTNGQIGRPVAGKTGTTENYADAWYAGYTPQISTAVWLGYAESNARSLYDIHGYPKVYGGSLPAMIWSRYMRAAHAKLPVASFPAAARPAGVNVPDVVGMLGNDAVTRLRDAGFFTVKKRFVRSSEPKGTVLAQSPGPEESVGKGSPVQLKISSGVAPEPSPSPTPSKKPSPTPTKKPSSTPTKKPTPKPSPSASPSPSPSEGEPE